MWHALNAHRDVLANAGSLLGATVVTSALGFVYWWLAARLFPITAVGYGSAAISAMVLLGTIGLLGLGTVLIGELPKRPRAGGLVAASLLVSAAASAALGAGFTLAAHVSGRLSSLAGEADMMALFVAGAALTGAALILDHALIGLLWGGLRLRRNTIFSVAKLVLLPLAAVLLHDRSGTGILASWVASIAVSMLLLAVILRMRGIPVVHSPQWAILRAVSRTAGAHHWLNLAIQSAQLMMPIMATGLVSATAGASFYLGWTILGFAEIVPVSLSTVLYAIGAGDVRALRSKIRFTLRLSLLAGLVSVPVLIAVAPVVLRLFGPVYAEQATLPLRLLAFGYFPTVVKVHYVAVCRIHGRAMRAAAVITSVSLLELGAAAAGAITGGLVGLSLGLLSAMCLGGAVTARTVLRVAFSAVVEHAHSSRAGR